LGELTDTNGITVRSKNLGDGNVADDDVGLLLDDARKRVSMELVETRGRVQSYSPKPVRTALESLPMMLVLLPILICLEAWVMGPETTTTFFAVPATAAVN
jgi:hypothetical protein